LLDRKRSPSKKAQQTLGRLLQRVLTAPLCSHEMSRVALLHPELRAGDVLVGDRAFGTFAHLALLVGRGLHGVFRMSQRRVVDFTPDRPQPPRWNTPKLTGQARSRWMRALGPTDQIVEWYKPYVKPIWMRVEEYAALPMTLMVRECQYRVTQSGFRVRTIILVTTLLDADAYPADELATLYFQRWEIEIYFRVLKSGCKIEDSQLERDDRFQPYLGLCMIVAWRVMFVMMLGRECPELPCDVVFDAQEWQAVYAVVKRETPPATVPSLGEMVVPIATLGGDMNRQGDGPPGPKAMWMGLQRMTDWGLAWQAFRQHGPARSH
jgi:hypothetical protein